MKIFLTILILIFSGESFGKDFSAEQNKLIKSAEEYLTGVNTIKAKFIQFSPETSLLSQGEFYLKKPGRLMFNYVQPYRTITHINDTQIIYYDVELDQLSYSKIDNNPLSILLYKDVKLSKNDILKIDDVKTVDNIFVVKLVPIKQDEDGLFAAFSLKFRKSPVELLGILTINSANQTTDVTFSDLQINGEVDDEVFNFKNPRYGRNKFPKKDR
jgi:outer membrane lipoprotein-sorting protein